MVQAINLKTQEVFICPICSEYYGKWKMIIDCDDCHETFVSESETVICVRDEALIDIGHYCENCWIDRGKAKTIEKMHNL